MRILKYRPHIVAKVLGIPHVKTRWTDETCTIIVKHLSLPLLKREILLQEEDNRYIDSWIRAINIEITERALLGTKRLKLPKEKV